MAELLVWRDEWLLGIEPFDADHKELVKLLNRLARPLKSAGAAASIRPLR